MTTHIERIVTDVVVEPEASTSGEPVDKRWSENMKIEAVIKHRDWYDERVSAEGFDD